MGGGAGDSGRGGGGVVVWGGFDEKPEQPTVAEGFCVSVDRSGSEDALDERLIGVSFRLWI